MMLKFPLVYNQSDHNQDFGMFQMLVNMYYFVFYYVCAINGLVNPGQLWMSDWAIIHAGATIQVSIKADATLQVRAYPEHLLTLLY